MMDSIPGRVYGSVHTQNKGSFGATAYGSDRQLHCCPYRVSASVHARTGTPIIPAEIASATRIVFATSQRDMRAPTKMLVRLPWRNFVAIHG